MKNKVIGAIVLIILLFVLTGCTSESNAEAQNRFIKVYGQQGYSIIVDKNTKVMYLITCQSYGNWDNTGITVLVDSEGKPLLYEGE